MTSKMKAQMGKKDQEQTMDIIYDIAETKDI